MMEILFESVFQDETYTKYFNVKNRQKFISLVKAQNFLNKLPIEH